MAGSAGDGDLMRMMRMRMRMRLVMKIVIRRQRAAFFAVPTCDGDDEQD